MFILEKPYVSDFLADTIAQNNYDILDNKIIEEFNFNNKTFNLVSSKNAKNYYLKQEYPLIYANSENAISWVLENLPESNISNYIRFFKDKVKFRELLKKLYPDFYFRAVSYDELKSIETREIKFPVVVKPSVGFLSFGVHTINNHSQWICAINKIDSEMKQAEKLYPDNVINSSSFIIEELIEGTEYAIDAYYDKQGEPVILNIFEHPFLDEKDVRDRIYITSKEIMVKYMSEFSKLLKNIGIINDIRNFPIHIEVRVRKDGKIIPIEVNPMRFAGWCTTDVANYAWGINVYEYFNKQKTPDWEEILNNRKEEIFYFSMAEISANINRKELSDFDYDKFLQNYSNVLELRKIDFKTHPLFAIIFGSTNNKEEIRRILALETDKYILQKV